MTRKNLPTANITIIIGKSKRRRSFFSYTQHQGRRIRHYGLTVLICFSVAPDYAIREILPDGLCPSGAAGPLALDYCLAGISTHSPPRPACPLVCGAPRRRQTSLGHGDACKGMPARDTSKGYQQGMPARDTSKGCQQGIPARDMAMGDVAIGVSSAYGLLPVVYQEATC